jgi:signal transduction histidine kinase
MELELLLEYSAFILFSFFLLTLSENLKNRTVSLLTGLLIFLILEVAFQFTKDFSLIVEPLVSKLLVSTRIITIGMLIALFREIVSLRSKNRDLYRFWPISITVAVLEIAIWSGLISFSDSGRPDLVLYILIPFIFLLELSFLSVLSKGSLLESQPRTKYARGNFILPPLIIIYIFFTHLFYPFTNFSMPIAIFYPILIFLLGYWMIISNIVELKESFLWHFITIGVVYISLYTAEEVLQSPMLSQLSFRFTFHLSVLLLANFVVVIFYWVYIGLKHKQKPEYAARPVTQFVQDLFKHLTWERFGPYVCNHFIRRFNVSRVALIIEGDSGQPFRILSQINCSEFELSQLLKSEEITWFDHLVKEQSGLYFESMNKDNELYAAFKSYKIGAILPIKVETAIRGMLLIADENENPYFSEEDKKEINFLMVQVAMAVDQLEMTEKYYQNEKMAEIGTFASQLAHDFRSFLSVIQLAPESTPFLKDLARQMGAMIQDLLTFVRPEELKLLPVNLNSLLDNSLEMITIPKSVKIEKQYEPDLPEISADINQLHRVFTNLFNNAVRAVMVKDGGRIKISTRKLRTFNIFENREWIYIEILDEGEGIPKDNLDKIFKPFFTSYKEQGGSGLGLSIVKKIIEAHGGIIDVTSVYGRGTAFNIRLPIRTDIRF